MPLTKQNDDRVKALITKLERGDKITILIEILSILENERQSGVALDETIREYYQRCANVIDIIKDDLLDNLESFISGKGSQQQKTIPEDLKRRINRTDAFLPAAYQLESADVSNDDDNATDPVQELSSVFAYTRYILSNTETLQRLQRQYDKIVPKQRSTAATQSNRSIRGTFASLLSSTRTNESQSSKGELKSSSLNDAVPQLSDAIHSLSGSIINSMRSLYEVMTSSLVELNSVIDDLFIKTPENVKRKAADYIVTEFPQLRSRAQALLETSQEPHQHSKLQQSDIDNCLRELSEAKKVLPQYLNLLKPFAELLKSRRLVFETLVSQIRNASSEQIETNKLLNKINTQLSDQLNRIASQISEALQNQEKHQAELESLSRNLFISYYEATELMGIDSFIKEKTDFLNGLALVQNNLASSSTSVSSSSSTLSLNDDIDSYDTSNQKYQALKSCLDEIEAKRRSCVKWLNNYNDSFGSTENTAVSCFISEFRQIISQLDELTREPKQLFKSIETTVLSNDALLQKIKELFSSHDALMQRETDLNTVYISFATAQGPIKDVSSQRVNFQQSLEKLERQRESVIARVNNILQSSCPNILSHQFDDLRKAKSYWDDVGAERFDKLREEHHNIDTAMSCNELVDIANQIFLEMNGLASPHPRPGMHTIDFPVVDFTNDTGAERVKVLQTKMKQELDTLTKKMTESKYSLTENFRHCMERLMPEPSKAIYRDIPIGELENNKQALVTNLSMFLEKMCESALPSEAQTPSTTTIQSHDSTSDKRASFTSTAKLAPVSCELKDKDRAAKKSAFVIDENACHELVSKLCEDLRQKALEKKTISESQQIIQTDLAHTDQGQTSKSRQDGWADSLEMLFPMTSTDEREVECQSQKWIESTQVPAIPSTKARSVPSSPVSRSSNRNVREREEDLQIMRQGTLRRSSTTNRHANGRSALTSSQPSLTSKEFVDLFPETRTYFSCDDKNIDSNLITQQQRHNQTYSLSFTQPCQQPIKHVSVDGIPFYEQGDTCYIDATENGVMAHNATYERDPALEFLGASRDMAMQRIANGSRAIEIESYSPELLARTMAAIKVQAAVLGIRLHVVAKGVEKANQLNWQDYLDDEVQAWNDKLNNIEYCKRLPDYFRVVFGKHYEGSVTEEQYTQYVNRCWGDITSNQVILSEQQSRTPFQGKTSLYGKQSSTQTLVGRSPTTLYPRRSRANTTNGKSLFSQSAQVH